MKKLGLILSASALLGLVACSSPEPEEPKSFLVTWIVDGNSSTEEYKEGETPTYKFGTEKASDNTYTYTFKGWDKDLAPVNEDITYTAVYESTYIDYVVTWVTAKGESVENYHYGDTPAFKGDTSKDSTAEFTYTFKGWDKEICKVTENVTYTALYEETKNSYTVTWVVDGKETSESYVYGETPKYTGSLEKAADVEFTYTFKGWDKEIVPVVENTTYTAIFTSAINEYVVTWVVGLDTTEEVYKYGETPSFKGSTDRESSAKFEYTFNGWDKPIEVVTGDATYVAQYDEVIRKYDINFYDETGETLLESKKREYDSIPSFSGETPTKEPTLTLKYTFDGWTSGNDLFEGALPSVIGNTNYYAHFKEEGRTFSLKLNCLNLDGSLIKTVESEHSFGESASIEVPTIDGKVANINRIREVIDGNKEVNVYYSDIDVYDGSSVSESLAGEGTVENPYLISSGADLAYLKSSFEGGNNYANKIIKLTKSIDLTNLTSFTIGSTDADIFLGTIDGNHARILNYNHTSTVAQTGLIHILGEGATIKNLTIDGSVTLTTKSGIFTYQNFGTIESCINYASLDGTDTIGVFAGTVAATGEVKNCVNEGSVTVAKKFAGSIAGTCYGIIDNCVNFGEVHGTYATKPTSTSLYIGGLVGGLYGTSIVKNSTNNGLVHGKCLYYGGIAGAIAGSASVEIRNCVNNGNVECENNGIGGILGGTLSSSTYVTIDGCKNTGSITGGTKSGLAVGLLHTGKGELTNFTNTGTLTIGGKASEKEIGAQS